MVPIMTLVLLAFLEFQFVSSHSLCPAVKTFLSNLLNIKCLYLFDEYALVAQYPSGNVPGALSP